MANSDIVVCMIFNAHVILVATAAIPRNGCCFTYPPCWRVDHK